MKKSIAFISLFLLFPAFLLSARRALIIGIDHYIIIDLSGEKLDLKGCANDALDIKNILIEKFDFKENEIRLLLNKDATKESILEGFQWLIRETKPQDWVIFSFSGYGTQVQDLNGDEEDSLTPQAELSNLINSSSTFSINLRLFGRTSNKIKLRDHVEFYVDSEKSGYLYLFVISTDGEVCCLLPNFYQRNNHIDAREGILIPPPDGKFSIETVEPLGKMRALAIVAERPLDLARFCGSNEEELLHTLGSDELKELVRSTREITRVLSPTEWATAVIEIDIVK